MKPAVPWLLVAAILLLLQYLTADIAGQLMYHRGGIVAGEAWRLLTANLVHVSWTHTLMNIGGLLLAAWLLPDTPVRLVFAAVLTIGLTVCTGIFLLNPQLDWYLGFSGITHGIVGMVIVTRLETQPVVSLVLLGATCLKLTAEAGGGAFVSGTPVVTDAHLYGFVGGVVFAIVRMTVLRHQQSTFFSTAHD